jgi:hypothetical protein
VGPAREDPSLADGDTGVRLPCPHPIEFRGTADCHLCGNTGFVLPGSPWTPPADVATEAEGLPGDTGTLGAAAAASLQEVGTP